MNDTELDEMLNLWNAPNPRPALRERVRTEFVARSVRKTNPGWLLRHLIEAVPTRRKGAIAGTIVSFGVFLLVITQAFPLGLKLVAETFPQGFGLAWPGFRIPYLVEYELTRYADDGSPKFDALFTGFKRGGDEVIVAEIYPGRPFLTNFRGIYNSIQLGLLQVVPSLVLPPEPSARDTAWFRAYVDSGCSIGESVVGQEKILDHPTTVAQSISPNHVRTTRWLAPDLGCFALKQTNEEERPDGTFRLVLRKQGLRVTLSH